MFLNGQIEWNKSGRHVWLIFLSKVKIFGVVTALQTTSFNLLSADCQLPAALCQLKTANCQLPPAFPKQIPAFVRRIPAFASLIHFRLSGNLYLHSLNLNFKTYEKKCTHFSNSPLHSFIFFRAMDVHQFI
jgi:hypothetical protein